MERRLAKLENDVINLYNAQKKQDENTKNLERLTVSIEVLVKEMEYMREDLCEIKADYKDVVKKISDHETGEITGRLTTYDSYKNKIILTIIGSVLAVIGALLFGDKM